MPRQGNRQVRARVRAAERPCPSSEWIPISLLSLWLAGIKMVTTDAAFRQTTPRVRSPASGLTIPIDTNRNVEEGRRAAPLDFIGSCWLGYWAAVGAGAGVSAGFFFRSARLRPVVFRGFMPNWTSCLLV